MNNSCTRKRKYQGNTLLEVLIGIVIFAVGMLALAQLQGNLTKSSTDSNARSVASNIAEEVIEAARSFNQVTGGPGVSAFNNIVTGSGTEQRGGINYTVSRVVTDYYFNPATGAFQTNKPAGNTNIVNAAMKKLALTVSWDTGQSFHVDQTQSASGLGTGSVTLTDMISSITSPSGGKVVLNGTTDGLYGPPVDYNPGSRPDIISIKLGENRFKESTTPLPDVIRADELVETAFDVVTYSQSDAGATFLRREEFRAVSCECTLRTPGTAAQGGLRPTIWNGNDYTEGEFISKPYGESANNQQSAFCTVCCRDHHDGGTGTEDIAGDSGRGQYDPFRNPVDYWTSATGGALAGDHKHYNRNNSGTLSVASSAGSTYVEACRLVRKDGFFRVAQDLRQEGLNSFPASYLDEVMEVAEYSKYVTDAVSAFEEAMTPAAQYEGSPPMLILPANMTPAVSFPASTPQSASTMSSTTPNQQLRSRGIYLDYMSDELRDIINCMDGGGSGTTCGAAGANSALEVIPFYDVQLTWLSRWNETPNNAPVNVSNQAIQDNNAHSRGLAQLTSGFGYSTIDSTVHKGNLGLTGTDPIDPNYAADVKSYNLYAQAINGGSLPPSGYTVSGTISSGVSGVKAADVEISATNAQCSRTLTGFTCTVSASASNPRITFSNYFKRTKFLVACSTVMVIQGTEHSGTDITQNWTRFNLPVATVPNANVLITENSCT